MSYGRVSSPLEFDPDNFVEDKLCLEALCIYGPCAIPSLDQLSISQCFDAKRHIVTSVLRRFPEPKDPNADNSIPKSAIPKETETLLLLARNIRLSSTYEDMITTAVQQAVQDLTSSVQNISLLMNWRKLDTETRFEVLKDFHNKIIEHARHYLDEDSELGRFLTPCPLKEFTTAAKRNANGDIIHILHGEARNFPYEVLINAHPDAKLDDLFETFNTVAHETAHIIEGLCSEFYSVFTKANIPHWMLNDASILYNQQIHRAYIPGRIEKPYRIQVNEYVAFKAGKTATNALKNSIAPYQGMFLTLRHATVM